MIYKKFKDKELSMLGMGCMRFPCDKEKNVDIKKTEEIIDFCIKNGVNYFDTAWFYHEGKSEEIIGKILKKYPRESFNIATKLPGLDSLKTRKDVEDLFFGQLEKTGMEYFDFYLIHNVSEDTIDVFENPELGVIDFLKEQVKCGKIKHLGFSAHAELELLEEYLKKYSDILEFCQIQLNWIDWSLQRANKKVELLNSYNIPIWVMEPVRGGKLAALNTEDECKLKKSRPDESIASWSFRFLQGIENVVVVLSGMSDLEQVKDNIKTFSEEKPLNSEEKDILFEIADNILSKKTLMCTNCRYCVDECPMELEIPKLLSAYNRFCLTSNIATREKIEEMTENKKMPDDCIGCRACERKCPQNIKISEIMKDLSQKI